MRLKAATHVSSARVLAIVVAYALVFRLAIPFAWAGPAVWMGDDPHALCLSQALPDAGGEPRAPIDFHSVCDACCLTAIAAVAPEPTASRLAEPAAKVLALAAPVASNDIRGPPSEEAWNLTRAQRGPPEHPLSSS